MEKKFKGWLFNRLENLGGETFNHVGCFGDDEKFIDFLTQFVPELGMKRKVTFIVQSEEEPETIEDYKSPKEYVEEYTKTKNEKNKDV